MPPANDTRTCECCAHRGPVTTTPTEFLCRRCRRPFQLTARFRDAIYWNRWTRVAHLN